MANLLDNPKSCKELGVPENMAAHAEAYVFPANPTVRSSAANPKLSIR